MTVFEDQTMKNESFDNLTDIVQPLLMPEWAYQLAGSYLIFISVVGVLLNLAVILVILSDPQRRTPLNWMLFNLTLSDGTIAGFGAPVSSAAAFHNGWIFSHEFCVTYAMIMSTAGIASITTLTILAFWRCTLVVCCPTNRHLTGTNGQLGNRQAVLLTLFIWIYSLAVTVPPLLGWGRYDFEAAHISCSVNWESKMDNNVSYIIYMFLLGLFIPVVVIVASYSSIVYVVHKTGEMKRKMLNNSAHSSGSEAVEKRVTLMVFFMVAAFITAWTPYSILSLVETFGKQGMSTVTPGAATVPSLFAKSSSVFNPLVYGLLNTQFRSTLASYWHRLVSSTSTNRLRRTDGVTDTMNATKRAIVTNPSPTVDIQLREIVATSNREPSIVSAKDHQISENANGSSKAHVTIHLPIPHNDLAVHQIPKSTTGS